MRHLTSIITIFKLILLHILLILAMVSADSGMLTSDVSSVDDQAKQYLDHQWKHFNQISPTKQTILLYWLVVLTSLAQAKTTIPDPYFQAAPLVQYLKTLDLALESHSSKLDDEVLQSQVFNRYRSKLDKYRSCASKRHQKLTYCCPRFGHKKIAIASELAVMFTNSERCESKKNGKLKCTFGQVMHSFVQEYMHYCNTHANMAINDDHEAFKPAKDYVYQRKAEFAVTVWPRFFKTLKYVKRNGMYCSKSR